MPDDRDIRVETERDRILRDLDPDEMREALNNASINHIENLHTAWIGNDHYKVMLSIDNILHDYALGWAEESIQYD